MQNPTKQAATRHCAARFKVLLIAPIGAGVGGIIAQTNALVGELHRQNLIKLRVLNSAILFRSSTDLRVIARARDGLWQLVRLSSQLVYSLGTFSPDSVHIRSSASYGLVRDIILVVLSRAMGTRIFVSYHFGRIPELAAKRNVEWYLLSLVARMASGVEVLDRLSLAVLLDNFPSRKFHIFPNGIDSIWVDEICDSRKALKATGDTTRVIFVGMIIKEKGVIELVNACASIDDCSLELELVGPTTPAMSEALQRIAATRDAGRWLHYSGALVREEAIKRIAESDIFVLPSYTEGFPISILEAMACRTAIIASAVGAIPEMLDKNGEQPCGLIVPPQDVDHLIQALKILCKDKELRKALASAARKKCDMFYRLDDLARKWVDLWRS